jgi:hypothetical protein
LNIVRPAGTQPGDDLPVGIWVHGGVSQPTSPTSLEDMSVCECISMAAMVESLVSMAGGSIELTVRAPLGYDRTNFSVSSATVLVKPMIDITGVAHAIETQSARRDTRVAKPLVIANMIRRAT